MAARMCDTSIGVGGGTTHRGLARPAVRRARGGNKEEELGESDKSNRSNMYSALPKVPGLKVSRRIRTLKVLLNKFTSVIALCIGSPLYTWGLISSTVYGFGKLRHSESQKS
jgi:hypothetical protein